MKNGPTYNRLYPHLSEGKEGFLTVHAAKRLLLGAVGSLVLAELIRRGEALVTFVASENYVSLQHERDNNKKSFFSNLHLKKQKYVVASVIT